VTDDKELTQALERLRQAIISSPAWDRELAVADAAVAPTPNEAIAMQLLEKGFPTAPTTFVTTSLDEASRRLVEQVWQLMLAGRSSRVRRSWHVNFILLRRLSWLNPIIRPAINLIRQELRQLKWEVVPLKREAKGRTLLAYRLLLNPHPLLSWGEWLDKMVEDSLAIDAAATEVWTARYIPFNITYPQLILPQLEEKKPQAPAPTQALPPDIEELIGLGARLRKEMMSSLLHTKRMAEYVVKERVNWLEECGLVKSAADIYRYIDAMCNRLSKARNLLEAHEIMLNESPAILKKTFGGSEEELNKAFRVNEPNLLPYPMDLPLALIPVPGEQIEFQGDIYLMVEDPYFPYLRVVNGVIMRAYQRDELMYVRENPRTWSFYGLSPIECVIIVAHVMLYAHDVQFRYFLTGAVPAAIVGVVGGGNISEIRAYLNEVARGKQEAIAVVGVPPQGNLIVQRLAETNRELQYIQLLEWYARLISIAFGLQPWELGILSGGTPSRRLLRQRPGIYGRFITWENAINFHILQRGFKLTPAVDAIFRFVNKDIGDFGEEAQAVGTLVERGIITRNEARHRLGYPPLVGGLPDHAYTVAGQALLLHGKTPPIGVEEEEVEIPSIPSPVGFWVPPPVGGVSAAMMAGRGGRGGAGGAGGLAGLLGLAKSLLPDPNTIYLNKFSDEVQTALKIFARGMVAGGEVKDWREGIALGVALKDALEKELKRPVSDGEWIGILRRAMDFLWETKWKAQWDELMSKFVDITDELKPPEGV
jgi:Phage portal protein.